MADMNVTREIRSRQRAPTYHGVLSSRLVTGRLIEPVSSVVPSSSVVL